ncbi:hypothetical protein O181_129332 [Austropuccinia psidii MF-1]|uniref:Uncharacterized protein n=1 Tax=Austropuccinia psidii MF-1 TaxID=1389203 RepID=A0A9Q3KZ09_9BASI|nr:hypothetical protein [Austropuccinia psidii MF-1]
MEEDGKIDDTEEVPPNANQNSPSAAIDNTGVGFGIMEENPPRIIKHTPQKPKSFPFGRRDLMSQLSSFSLELGRKEQNFENDIVSLGGIFRYPKDHK